jgi:hypothetical protein
VKSEPCVRGDLRIGGEAGGCRCELIETRILSEAQGDRPVIFSGRRNVPDLGWPRRLCICRSGREQRQTTGKCEPALHFFVSLP